MEKQSVVLINRSLAERYWPGEKAVGKRITFTSEPKEQDWRTVVGVVGDVKDHPDSATAVPAFYFSLTQSPTRQVTLAVREQRHDVGEVHVRRERHLVGDRSHRCGETRLSAEVATGLDRTAVVVGAGQHEV